MTSLEPWPSARSKRGGRAPSARAPPSATSRPRPLAAKAPAAVAADRRVRDPEALAQLERLREVARGHLDLVAVARAARSITGRSTSTCGELVRSIQTRIAAARLGARVADRRDDLDRLRAIEHRAHRDRQVASRASSSVTGSARRRRSCASPAGGGRACGSRPRAPMPTRSSAGPSCSASGWRITYRCQAGSAPSTRPRQGPT